MTVYLAAYGIWRFFIEFLRADDRGAFVGVLSPSQTLSLGLVLLAVPAFFLTRYFMQKMEDYLAIQMVLEGWGNFLIIMRIMMNILEKL